MCFFLCVIVYDTNCIKILHRIPKGREILGLCHSKRVSVHFKISARHLATFFPFSIFCCNCCLYFSVIWSVRAILGVPCLLFAADWSFLPRPRGSECQRYNKHLSVTVDSEMGSWHWDSTECPPKTKLSRWPCSLSCLPWWPGGFVTGLSPVAPILTILDGTSSGMVTYCRAVWTWSDVFVMTVRVGSNVPAVVIGQMVTSGWTCLHAHYSHRTLPCVLNGPSVLHYSA